MGRLLIDIDLFPEIVDELAATLGAAERTQRARDAKLLANVNPLTCRL